MLLGDADVEEAIGEAHLERQQPRGAGHRCGDGHEPRVGLGLLDDRVGERLGVAGGHGGRRAHSGVEDGRVVEVLLVVVLGGWVAPSLLGEDVHHDGTLGGELDGVAEGDLELLDVVTIDGADVAHAECFEERRRLQELAHGGLERLDALLGLRADVGQVAQETARAGAGGVRTPG